MTEEQKFDVSHQIARAICLVSLAMAFCVAIVWMSHRRSATLNQQQTASAKTAATPAATTVPPTKYVPPPPPTKGHYKHVGFNGSYFRVLKPGDIEGLEGGLMAMNAKDGAMWLIDAEPSDNHGPLAQRKVYLARISGELVDKHCGVWLPDYKSVPAMCIEEERVVSWKAAKAFMTASTSKLNDVTIIETFLTERSRKE